MTSGASTLGVENVLGYPAVRVAEALERLEESIGSPVGAAAIIEAFVTGRLGAVNSMEAYDLVLSGPDVPGIPTANTAAVIQSLFEQATSEVLLVGYAIHDGKKLFARLAERMAEHAELAVLFCLDIQRPFRDTSLDSEIVARFEARFREKHWPWVPKPRVFYDPRSVCLDRSEPSSLHAKCVVIDRRLALISSANFTESALTRNVEAGVLMRDPSMAKRLDAYFRALCASGSFKECHP
jgi:phosphatidylserine/phosphatidylglycerophosphate/cardiolipin synthase-like enzyme